MAGRMVRHSGSSAPGEMVTVAVKTANDVIRIEVTQLCGDMYLGPMVWL